MISIVHVARIRVSAKYNLVPRDRPPPGLAGEKPEHFEDLGDHHKIATVVNEGNTNPH